MNEFAKMDIIYKIQIEMHEIKDEKLEMDLVI